jgi:hypothetical protein
MRRASRRKSLGFSQLRSYLQRRNRIASRKPTRLPCKKLARSAQCHPTGALLPYIIFLDCEEPMRATLIGSPIDGGRRVQRKGRAYQTDVHDSPQRTLPSPGPTRHSTPKNTFDDWLTVLIPNCNPGSILGREIYFNMTQTRHLRAIIAAFPCSGGDVSFRGQGQNAR